jgi:hypothetical protein
VALVRTDVSEEPGASFIRVTKIGALGTTQAATSNLMKEAPGSSEMSVLTRATRRNIPGDGILQRYTWFRSAVGTKVEAKKTVTCDLERQLTGLRKQCDDWPGRGGENREL